jgi:hypothetical protein
MDASTEAEVFSFNGLPKSAAVLDIHVRRMLVSCLTQLWFCAACNRFADSQRDSMLVRMTSSASSSKSTRLSDVETRS